MRNLFALLALIGVAGIVLGVLTLLHPPHGQAGPLPFTFEYYRWAGVDHRRLHAPGGGSLPPGGLAGQELTGAPVVSLLRQLAEALDSSGGSTAEGCRSSPRRWNAVARASPRRITPPAIRSSTRSTGRRTSVASRRTGATPPSGTGNC